MMNRIQQDEIFKLNTEFQRDPRKEKINGGIGIYLDERGKPYVHPVVRKAIAFLNFHNFNYLPISGDQTFLNETTHTMIGNDLFLKYNKLIAKQGVMGGTNGLYIWASLVKKIHSKPKIIIGTPTWENHQKIFAYLGFKIIAYNHLFKSQLFNINELVTALEKHPKSYILFHAGPTHNPTGINASKNQWVEIAGAIKEYKQRVIFDFAYMGLGENIDVDSFPVRHFIQKKIPTSAVVSFSKNMTLYQHRTGALFILAKSKREKNYLEENLKYLFRITNSNPSAFGELVSNTILESRELKGEWIDSLAKMVKSLDRRRDLFAKYTKGKFNFVKKGKGLFSLLG